MTTEPKPIRLSTTGKFITVAIIVVLAILLFANIGAILAPFIGAAITAYLFNPLISWLQHRTRVGRSFWILVLYFVCGLLLYMLGRFLVPLISKQYTDLIHHLPRLIDNITEALTINTTWLPFTFDIASIEQPLIDLLNQIGRSLPETVPHLVFTAVEVVLLFVTYLLATYYLLLNANTFMDRVYSLVPAPYRDEIRQLGHQIDRILAGYVRGTLLLIPIMSLLTYIVLRVLGIPYALVIAIASGILETIPLVGPWTAAGIAMSVSFFQPVAPFGWDHWVLVAAVGVSYFILRMFEDNFIIPHVVGHAVKLHPVLVIFAILAGGALAGPFGLFVGIPVAAIVQLLLRYFYGKLVDSPEPLLPPSEPEPPPVAETAAVSQAADEAESPPPALKPSLSPASKSQNS